MFGHLDFTLSILFVGENSIIKIRDEQGSKQKLSKSRYEEGQSCHFHGWVF